jgi:beta-xylosidase
MQTVTWKNAWPVIGIDVENIGCGEPQHVYPVPDCYVASKEPLYLKASDNFSLPELCLQWQWLANSKKEFYSLTERPGALRLYTINPTGESYPLLWNCANVLTQKLVCPAFTADFDIDISGLQEGGQAGIVMIGGEYSALAFRKETDGVKLVYFESETIKEKAQIKDTKTKEQKKENVLYSIDVDKKITTGTLRILFDANKVCHMSFCLSNEADFTEIPFSSTPKDHTWVGAKIGIFSTALESCNNHGFADFTNVLVTMIK